jgi:hypothetical protein
MRISRRGFIAIAGAAPLGGALFSRTGPTSRKTITCALEESRAGYDIALRDSAARHLVVFPAAVGWDPSIARRTRDGATVIFESAGGFGDIKAFEEQRSALRSDFGLAIETPTAVSDHGPQPAYIDMLWPSVATIRDFSSLVVVRGGNTVGQLGSLPVAALQRLGAGSLVFLGSPIGPALWTRDPQAHAWLSSILGATRPYAWTPGASWPVRSTYST